MKWIQVSKWLGAWFGEWMSQWVGILGQYTSRRMRGRLCGEWILSESHRFVSSRIVGELEDWGVYSGEHIRYVGKCMRVDPVNK